MLQTGEVVFGNISKLKEKWEEEAIEEKKKKQPTKILSWFHLE